MNSNLSFSSVFVSLFILCWDGRVLSIIVYELSTFVKIFLFLLLVVLLTVDFRPVDLRSFSRIDVLNGGRPVNRRNPEVVDTVPLLWLKHLGCPQRYLLYYFVSLSGRLFTDVTLRNSIVLCDF